MKIVVHEETKTVLKKTFNIVEHFSAENIQLKASVQKLKNEVNILKGEQGTPKIRKQTSKDPKNHSSENERKRPTGPKKKKGKKKNEVKIDRKVVLDVIDKSKLPDDVVFHSYETNIFQNIIIKTDNVEFTRRVYYSASLNKTFIADLPDGYYGGFGPETRALVISLAHDAKMTQPNIRKTLKAHGIKMSKATVSRILTNKIETFHDEKKAIVSAGLKSTPFQHLDDTSARVNGVNHYTHVLCNQFYSAYFTVKKKNRLSVLEILTQEELMFSFTEESFNLMLDLGLSEKNLVLLKHFIKSETLARPEVDMVLNELFPPSNKKKYKTQRKVILESAAIVFYRSTPNAIQFLVCDDAPQFNHIALHKALCWIHEGRHYKKLIPILELHKTILEEFRTRFWEYYHRLLDYTENPSNDEAASLSEEFNLLFSTKTGYDDLDERIALTLAKQDRLLLVLQYPFLPLHNNPAELAARTPARSRDINLQTKNERGTKAKDTFFTIVETAQKLGVSVYHYILDRLTQRYEMPSLAHLIHSHSATFADTS
tara:strand:+ start:435 stop:2060 length:1626 start_codon:yes stop_codon:yes gene_type:complete